jgi:hypothetical protein
MKTSKKTTPGLAEARTDALTLRSAALARSCSSSLVVIPFSVGVLGGTPETYISEDRSRAGGRHLRFHDYRDNVLPRSPPPGPASIAGT